MTRNSAQIRTVFLLTVAGGLFGFAPVQAGDPQPLIAFVTSTSGLAKLGDWADAGIEVGTSAGDKICQAHAQAAGLDSPSSFVAWISDTQDDAYCRVHGLSGKVATDCGQPALPAAAGPWLRTDGRPFGSTIDQMISPTGQVFLPALLDENGTEVDFAAANYHTATRDTGTLGSGASLACSDWTSDSASGVTYGNALRSTENWSDFGTGNCGESRRLLCLQTGVGADLPAFDESGRIAFLTSDRGQGKLASWPDALGATGLAAADAICRARAQTAGLDDASSFSAWLSDSTTDAATRFAHDGPWVRLDGIRVADSIADLMDGRLSAPINVTENGTYAGNYAAYTGTSPGGLGTVDDCDGWTVADTGASATYGVVNTVDSRWIAGISSAFCSSNFHLYCLSDVETGVIFTDGFESGDTTRWSSLTP